MILHAGVASNRRPFSLRYKLTNLSFLSQCAGESSRGKFQQRWSLRTAIFGLLLLTPCLSNVEAQQTNTFPNDGNVGVGTMSPLVKIHSVVNSNNTSTLNVGSEIGLLVTNSNPTANNISAISFANSTQAGQAQIGVVHIGLAANSGGHLFFNTRAAGGGFFERMRLTSAGFLGIGTTVPTSKLTVSSNEAPLPAFPMVGTTMAHFSAPDASHTRVLIDSFGAVPALDFRRANNTAASPSSIVLDEIMGQISWFGRGPSGYGVGVRASIRSSAAENWSDTAQGTYLSFSTATKTTTSSVERVRITDAGDLLIGTTVPEGKLTVLGAITLQGNTAINTSQQNPQLARQTGGQLSIAAGADPNSRILFYTGSTAAERMRIDIAGNVGIGTPAPAHRLDVQGGKINSSDGLCINGDCKTAWSQVTGTQPWLTSGSDLHYNTGNVGVGTTGPLSRLHVAKAATLADVTSANQLMVGVDNTPGYNFAIGYYNVGSQYAGVLQARSGGSGSPLLLNPSGGNVGIGTPTPNYKLDVDGALNATSINLNGAPLINSQWTTSGSAIHYNTGNVGIGTLTPAHKLDVAGSFNATAINVNGTPVVSSQWTTSGNDISYANGNVGIGTAGSPKNLHVAGNVTVDGIINAKYQDVAEWVPSTYALSAGTVVTLDPTKSNHVEASSKAYDTRVAGVVSAQPGIALGEKRDNKLLVATTGRVKVMVDASAGPIGVGDLLVTSDIAGVAMKSEPVQVGKRSMHMPGTLIGKALEPLAKGRAEILVLLSLQ